MGRFWDTVKIRSSWTNCKVSTSKVSSIESYCPNTHTHTHTHTADRLHYTAAKGSVINRIMRGRLLRCREHYTYPWLAGDITNHVVSRAWNPRRTLKLDLTSFQAGATRSGELDPVIGRCYGEHRSTFPIKRPVELVDRRRHPVNWMIAVKSRRDDRRQLSGFIGHACRLGWPVGPAAEWPINSNDSNVSLVVRSRLSLRVSRVTTHGARTDIHSSSIISG